MRKWQLCCLGLVAVAFLFVASVPAQETVPSPGSFFPEPGNRKIDGNLHITGTLYKGTAQTDWVRWFPAVQYCVGDNTSTPLISNRVAQFDWALARTGAGAETINVICTLDIDTRTTTSAGYKLTGFDIVYQNTVAAVTTHTWGGVRTVTYANNAANSIASIALSTTPTLNTATQTQPYLTSGVLTTPAFLNTASKAVVIEWTAVLASTTVYRIYGVAAKFSRAD